MKIALLSILIFSSLSLFAKHSYEDKSIINSRFIRKSFLDHKKLKLLKKGRKSGFYAEDIKLLKQKKKQILKKIIALFQGPIKIEEIENSQLDILSSKVYDPTNTYEISKAYVQYDHFFNKRIKLHLEKKQSFYTLNLDISNLSYGDHRANFLFKIKSKRKILWFKRTYYVYNQIDFKRVEAPSIFANLELESFAEGAYVKLDASNSTSESSAITNYEFISYKDGVEVDRINSEYSAVYLDFYDIGNYELQVKVTNDKGRSSFSEKIAHKALRTTPTLNYTLKKDESLLGHYNIDLGRTVDKDGDDIIFYRLTLYYLDAEDYVTVFDNYYETSKISFSVNDAGI